MASPSPRSSSEAGESEIKFPAAAASLPDSDASEADDTLRSGEFPHPEVVSVPPQEHNGDATAVTAAILPDSDASKLAKEIQDTVGCMICHSVVRRSAPVYASQGKCLDSPYWRCPGCGLVYATPASLAYLLENDSTLKTSNSVPQLRGAGGLSLRSPLPEDTATTRRYSTAAASPPDSASKLPDDDGFIPSAAAPAPHLNPVPEDGLASQHKDMAAASNLSIHPVPVAVAGVRDQQRRGRRRWAQPAVETLRGPSNQMIPRLPGTR